MGHAMNKILKDIINKFRTYQGYKCKFIPGWDCHGLPIELKVLQSLKPKERRGLTPLKLREVAAKFALETVQEQRKSFERYGVWGDFDEPYLTLLPKYEAAQLGVFEEMVRGGHIYRGFKPVYWSPSTRTALAESELEYPEDHTSQSIYACFRCVSAPAAFEEKVSPAGLAVAVWTTTPWTIPANRAVAVNPELDYAVVGATTPDGDKLRLVVASGLVEALQEKLKLELAVEATFKGSLLEGLMYEHPITGVETPVVIGGDYITTESGTGLVHTAPGHGQDDYQVGLKYGLEVAAPVDNAGNFTEEVGLASLVGANVLKDANDRVIEVLQGAKLLLLESPYKHKYPYDWRSKKPVITRATPQWFASIDGMREDCLKAVDEVQFIPASYSKRIRPMLIGRSDWCISRQRSWGVPIPVFYHKDTDEPLMTAETVAHVRGIVAEKGTNAWFEMDEVDLLPDEYKAVADQYVKGTDTMDVWFDSGSSWAAVREDLGSPDQLDLRPLPRGVRSAPWLVPVVPDHLRGVPRQGALQAGHHARLLPGRAGQEDEQVHRERGGPVRHHQRGPEPEEGSAARGGRAALLGGRDRTDYSNDVAISGEILTGVATNYRKLRNRFRFLLGNISDFDPAEHGVGFGDMPLIDQYQILEAERTFQDMSEAYDTYAFGRANKSMLDLLQNLSSLYLTIAKDRLYIDAKDSLSRRSCQTVLHWLVKNMARATSPVLCHLAEDVWQNLPHAGDAKSVFLSGWCEPFPREGDPEAGSLEDLRQETVLRLRDPVNAALEEARKSNLMKDSLEVKASIFVPADSQLRQHLKGLDASRHPTTDYLRDPELMGLSAVEVVEGAPEGAEGTASATSEESSVSR
ncbi:unnamed protein product [Prorocentrum cordatum]|uniref:isoleucine--tRNA ligase n=1 Tax=Prorocentrum cordatum TaxID=2364126 RepID=A0ABN9W8I5_9DINO|nr:unnamed protein product [Polarella glacialis]